MAIQLTSPPKMVSFRWELQEGDNSKADFHTIERAYAGAVLHELPRSYLAVPINVELDDVWWDDEYGDQQDEAWIAAGYLMPV